nr:hypothetical protein [Tanacetum cinerariifolium]
TPQKDNPTILGDDVHKPSIPSPTPPTPPPQQSQDLPSISQVQHTPPQLPLLQSQPPPPAQPQVADFPISLLQEVLDAYAALARRVGHLEYDKVAQALEITKLKIRVKQLERGNKVKGRMIDKLDRDEGVALMDDEGAKKKPEEAQEDEPEVQEVVDVVTTAKLITKVVTIAIRVTAASTRRRKGVVIRDPEEESTTIILADTKSKDKVKGIMDVAIDHVKQKAKEDPYVQRYQEENRAIQSLNETPAQKAAKRRKLNEEVEDLKQHLEIVLDEDDDVYTEATPLARKVPVMDYEIIHFNNKPHYKIIRANGTYQLYVSFTTLLKNFDKEDLESLWSLVK